MATRITAKNKTVVGHASVKEFLASVDHPGRREDAFVLLELMKEVTGETPKMWGSSIVGFGSYHYVYESGREGDLMLTGFSPRKANLVVYVMPGFEGYERELAKLGKARTGKSCLYLGRLAGVDLEALRRLVGRSVEHMRKKYEVR